MCGSAVEFSRFWSFWFVSVSFTFQIFFVFVAIQISFTLFFFYQSFIPMRRADTRFLVVLAGSGFWRTNSSTKICKKQKCRLRKLRGRALGGVTIRPIKIWRNKKQNSNGVHYVCIFSGFAFLMIFFAWTWEVWTFRLIEEHWQTFRACMYKDFLCIYKYTYICIHLCSYIFISSYTL